MDELLSYASKLADTPAQPINAPIQGRIAYMVSHGQSYASNGYAIRTQGIAHALNQHGFETLCFVRPGRPWELNAESNVAPETTIEGVRYIHTRWKGDATPKNGKPLLEESINKYIELFKVYRPSAVLAASNHAVGLPAWVAAKRLGLPFYNEVRGFWELSRAAREPEYENSAAFQKEAELDAFVAQQAQKVFTLNQPMKEELVKRGVKAKNIAIVPNGVTALPNIKPANPALKKRLGIEEGDKVVGYIGSFSAYEGLEVLLEACAQLVGQGEKIKLLLVGDEQPITKVVGEHSVAKEAGSTPWLIQVGRVPHEQVGDYYALLDAVVIPRKPLAVCNIVPPIKAAEALSYSKRLVLSDVAPLAEYAKKHKGVVSFNADNASSLVESLQGSLKLPVPKPSTELLFAKHTEPMVRALKGEGSAAVQKAVVETQAQPIQSEPKSKAEPKASAKAVAAPKVEKNSVEELPEEVKWESHCLDEGEVLSLSGEVVGKGVKGRKSVILVEAKGASGDVLDLSTYGYLWSDAFGHWFKYLYPNETKGRFFEFKNDEGEVKVSFALLKFGCRAGEKVFIENKRVETTTSSSIEDSLQHFLMDSPSLLDTESLLYADITLNVIDGSSIWLSSMAKILASQQKTILLIKEDVRNFQIFDSLNAVDNLIILQPSDFMGEGSVTLDVSQSIQCLRVLDNYIPSIKNVVVRGLSAAVELHSTRQFKYRSFAYLTDFYSYDNNELTITDAQEQAVKQIARQVHGFFVQTSEIEKKLKELSGFEINTTLIPPPLPDIGFRRPKPIEESEINIIYAGKITPAWGVVELLDWTEKLKSKGYNVRLTVIANKISAPGAQGREFRGLINKRFKELGVYHIPGLPREEVLEYLAAADFVWCYRPKELEESVLELSTKLVEAVACGARAINYPSKIHENLLGKDYPFFVSSFEDLETLIVNAKALDSFDTSIVAEKVIKDHSMTTAAGKVSKVINSGDEFGGEKIVFAGHDRKFIDAYYSYLKSKGAKVRFDEWEWGSPGNEKRSKKFLVWADKIFCEWGLANSVWYSAHNTDAKPLFVRIHLQEINPRAKKFGNKIEQANVSKFIVVSERVRQEAERMFGWESDKSVHIPNFVFDDEFTISEKRLAGKNEKIVLGMVGIVPQRKRFDRAIDLLLALRKKGYDAELVIKGPRPEEYEFMHSASRSPELDYYNACYDKINEEPLIKGRVSFVPWGNDMPLWYESVDYILSPSDFESFHYAVADGVLSGCYPLIWPWEESGRIYSSEWCVGCSEDAVLLIDEFYGLDRELAKKKIVEKRALVSERYGFDGVSKKLSNLLIFCARAVKMRGRVYER
ncbi:glycosyltransferase [Halomonas sp. BMC6]|uniref:glycosyltransferase n=1 Tax=Halomonas sp. BMC6 TaxID=3073244 RepID=UPI0030CE8EB7